MEITNTNVGTNPLSLSSNTVHRQNPSPISQNSVLEKITSVQGKRRDRPMKGQLGPKKQNKLSVSQNPENTKRNTIDSTNSSVALSPEAMKSAAHDYLEREKNRVTTDKTPAIFNSYGCQRQDKLGNAKNLNFVDKSPIPNIDSSIRRINTEMQQTFEKPNAQFEHIQLSIPGENVDINNLCSSSERIESDFCTSFPLEEDVKPFQHIIVDGTDITYDIPEDTRNSYFNLCRTQNSTLLHINLSEGIPPKHAVFIICETVTIANAIKGFNLSTPHKDIAYWGKALDSYSSLGMNVGFLRTRITKILDIEMKATKAVDRKRYEEAKAEGEGIQKNIKCFELNIEEMIEKIRGLELEIEKMTDKIGCFELEIENMREKKMRVDEERDNIRKMAEEFEAMLMLEATAPW